MQEMAFQVLQISKYFQAMPRTRVDVSRAFVAPFVPPPPTLRINNKKYL